MFECGCKQRFVVVDGDGEEGGCAVEKKWNCLRAEKQKSATSISAPNARLLDIVHLSA